MAKRNLGISRMAGNDFGQNINKYDANLRVVLISGWPNARAASRFSGELFDFEIPSFESNAEFITLVAVKIADKRLAICWSKLEERR